MSCATWIVFCFLLLIITVNAGYYVVYSDPPRPFWRNNQPYGILLTREIEFFKGGVRVNHQGYAATSTLHEIIHPWTKVFDGYIYSNPGASKWTYDDVDPKLTIYMGNQLFDTITVHYQTYDNHVIGSKITIYDDSTTPHTMLFTGSAQKSGSQTFGGIQLVKTAAPTVNPTSHPTLFPTNFPTYAPTVSPTFAPSTFPTSIPTDVPSSIPTMIPTQPQCEYQDREYCNNRGYCKEDGNHCECDDVLHYWPSELCAIYHDGRELAEGQYCYPNAVDFYCSWLGRCNVEGTACDCYDPEHRSSADRCLSWTPEPPIVVGEDDACIPYDRSYCNNRGYCNAAGDGCECDDYLHFWPSEKCSTYHDGRELAEGQCCYPNTVDYYCSWMGLCVSDGSGCACYDSEHRLPSERCQNWHMEITLPETPSEQCPPLPVEHTAVPSLEPTLFPTLYPTISHAPTHSPTSAPTRTPSLAPTHYPTHEPTPAPTNYPTLSPTSYPTVNPTAAPSVNPTYAPSASPTRVPTPVPTYKKCTPGDRNYCKNQGYCSENGQNCVCDDVLHYWPSERCEYYHDGRELPEGQFCYPHTIDYYCSWLGVCNEAGTGCNCFDNEHRSSTDRCATYSPAAPTSPPSTKHCTPGDRGFCNNRGVCASTGDACQCDDPMHYWSSERCSTEHYGGQLFSDDDCCIPGSSDYYCSWLGQCNIDGITCDCYDAEHRLSSERCQYWHESTDDLDNHVPEGECPALVSILSRDGSDKSSSESNGDDASFAHTWPYVVISIGLLAVVAFGVIRWKMTTAVAESEERRSSFIYNSGAAGDFEMASPMYGSQQSARGSVAEGSPLTLAALPPRTSDAGKPRRRSSLLPFTSSDVYEEVDECEVGLPAEANESISCIVDQESFSV